MPGPNGAQLVHLVEYERREAQKIMEKHNLTHYQEYGLIICNNCHSAIGPTLANHLAHCSKRPSKTESHLLTKFYRSLSTPYSDPKAPLPHLPFKEVLVGLKCPYSDCVFYTKTWNVWMKHGNEVHGGLGEDNPVPCLIQCLYDIHAPSSMQVYYPVIPTDEAKALVKNYSDIEMEKLLGSLNLWYDMVNKVLICTACPTGVTKRLTNHLKLHGLYLSRHEYFLILFHCFTEDSIYWKRNDHPIPALPYLPVENGIKCNICNYSSKVTSTMREHIREAHPEEDPHDYSECLVQRVNKAYPFYIVTRPEGNAEPVEQEIGAEIVGLDMPEIDLEAAPSGQTIIQEKEETTQIETNAHQHERPIRPLNYTST